MDLIARLLARRPQHDGASATLEAAVTGLSAPLLDVAALASPTPAHRAAPPPAGRTMLREAVLAKVLHGWLQNRHQTLFPLSVNLAALDPAQRATLAGFAAVCLLADGPHAPGRAERDTRVRRWLAAAGADPATLAALDHALASPPATSRVLDDVTAHDVAPYAYVAALVALDTRDGPGLHLLDYLAARLALPATLVRSTNRRYRR